MSVDAVEPCSMCSHLVGEPFLPSQLWIGGPLILGPFGQQISMIMNPPEGPVSGLVGSLIPI